MKYNKTIEYLENIDKVDSKIFHQHLIYEKQDERQDEKPDKIIGFKFKNNKLTVIK